MAILELTSKNHWNKKKPPLQGFNGRFEEGTEKAVEREVEVNWDHPFQETERKKNEEKTNTTSETCGDNVKHTNMFIMSIPKVKEEE